MRAITLSGFGFDWDAAAVRLEALCVANGITTRAQFITKWQSLTQAQQFTQLARVVLGAAVFPDDDKTRVDSQYIGNASTV